MSVLVNANCTTGVLFIVMLMAQGVCEKQDFFGNIFHCTNVLVGKNAR